MQDCDISIAYALNTLGPRQNGRHFTDDIFKCFFLNENVWIPIKISLNFVPKGPINNIPALVQIMAWRRPGDKPLSEVMMVNLPTHICVTRPEWVKIPQSCISSVWMFVYICRDYSVYAHSQWETTLYCNIVSHWRGTYIEWFLYLLCNFILLLFNLFLYVLGMGST